MIWPRNCLPSVHLASALVMVWSAPRSTWLAAVSWVYLVTMSVSTMVDGGHYLVDLIVAVPFTLTIWRGVQRQWFMSAIAGLLWMLWVFALRMDSFRMARSWTVWAAAVLTLIACAMLGPRRITIVDLRVSFDWC